MSELVHVQLLAGGDALALTWADGTTYRYHAVWLRDNALDETTRSAGNGQRLITIQDVPADTRIDQARITDDGGLSVRFLPEGKIADYPPDWLRANAYDIDRPEAAIWVEPHHSLWDRDLAASVPEVDFAAAARDKAVLFRWLFQVRRVGFAKMTGLSLDDGAVCRAAELFGHVRETNYGRWFDVKSEIAPVNLAYTGLGLQAHTDNPYRDPVPTLQLLACLENSADGGDSIVVDGFLAAHLLWQEDPAAFELLARYPARFEFSCADGVSLFARRPIIERTPQGELICIPFNNRSLAPVADEPFDHMAAYYAAYRKFAEIIERPALQVTFKLDPGELFIVDNTRVLHARKAYSGAGRRWLQGCYADRDGLLSTIRWAEMSGTTAA